MNSPAGNGPATASSSAPSTRSRSIPGSGDLPGCGRIAGVGAAVRFLGLLAILGILPACGIRGNGTLNPTVEPGIPTGVTALPGNRSVKVTWTASAIDARYTVLRSRSPAGPFLPISTPAQFLTPTSYRDEGLINGLSYFYVVSASNNFGQSAPSQIVTATPGFKATAVASGESFGIALLPDQTVWAWGDNQDGQLGNPAAATVNNTPLRVSGLEGVAAIAAGGSTGVAMLGDGSVWQWGTQSPLTKVQNLTGVTAVAAGGRPGTHFSSFKPALSFGLALESDGTVWGWGSNGNGELGNGVVGSDDATNGGTAGPALTPAGIIAISAGPNFALALRDNGTVWAWGDNSWGQLGNGSFGATPVPTPGQVVNLTDVIAISAGAGIGLAIRSDGSVWAWGANDTGELGIGSLASTRVTIPAQVALPPGSSITAIAAGLTHSLALDADGSVWGWGDNQYAELGTGAVDVTPVSTPVQVHNLSQATAISAGYRWSMAIFGTGSVGTWGENSSGQLGIGHGQDYPVPTEVSNLTGATAISMGDGFGLAVRTDGSLYAWGDNSTGELGLGSAAPESALPVPVAPAGSTFTQCSGGLGFGLALSTAGRVWAWGDNNSGEIGNGSTSATPVTTPFQVGLPAGPAFTAISAGGGFGLALRADGTVWAWGDNTSGTIGNGTASGTPVTTPVQVHLPAGSVMTGISAGPNFGLAVRSDGTVWAWGDDSYGQVGDGTGSLTSVSTPVQVVLPAGPAVTAVCAGGGFFTKWYGLPGLTRSYFALALRSDGSVWGWGDDSYGALGSGTFLSNSVQAPEQVPTPPGSVMTALGAGDTFGVALRSDGTVWGWGSDTAGQLGSSGPGIPTLPPVSVSPLTGVSAMSAKFSSVLMLQPDQSVWGLGSNASDQLGIPYIQLSTLPVLIAQ